MPENNLTVETMSNEDAIKVIEELRQQVQLTGVQHDLIRHAILLITQAIRSTRKEK